MSLAPNRYKRGRLKIRPMAVRRIPDATKSVKEFISDEGYKFPVYFDTQYSAAYAYGVSGIPMSVFINADGTVSDAHVGAMSEEALRNYIDGITGG